MRYRTRKILLADDSKGFLGLMTEILERMGFNVLQAANGSEAIRIMKGGARPDLIILDVYMPEMDGFQTLEAVKHDSVTKDIPVVMLSVDTKDSTIGRCRKLGCEDYLGKPVNIESLHEVLQKMLFSMYGQTRKYVRAELDSDVQVSFDGGEEVLKATTISEGGIFLVREDPLPVGTEVLMRIDIEGDRVLKLEGRVIYTNPFTSSVNEAPPGMALEFVGLGEGDTAKLSDYILHLLTN